jgi:hypothetical protein
MRSGVKIRFDGPNMNIETSGDSPLDGADSP